MFSRMSRPARQPVPVALCLIAATFLAAFWLACEARAAEYKMVACAADTGVAPYYTTTNTSNPQNPAGIFEFHNWCTGRGGDPPGDASYMRIVENQAAGNANHGAFGAMVFDTPPYVHFRSAGGYTRQPNAFNGGWLSRFWAASSGGSQVLMTQGAGLPNSNGQWAASNIFGSHLWPFSQYLDFTRFVFELSCYSPSNGGCDRANYNATDANGFVFILSDDSPSQTGFPSHNSAMVHGEWARGEQWINWNTSEQGSGIRFEKLRVDGNEIRRLDFGAAGQCDVNWTQTNGEWARRYTPCPTGSWTRDFLYNTATLADGAHWLMSCSQDFAQYQGLNGTGHETCEGRTIRTDNTAPAAASGLRVTSANPHRYLSEIGAQFSLPANSGSPITKVHYDVIDAAGKQVVALKTLTGVNPTELVAVKAPAAPGEYRLRVWLEDQVGLLGPPATAPIPRDTTPPAAPQALSVTAPRTARVAQGFDVAWRNIRDAGSPIAAAHYEVLDPAGQPVIGARTSRGEDLETIANLDTPAGQGEYTLRLWLSDAEGNVGAPVSAPLSYECVRSDVGGGLSLSAGVGAGRAVSEVLPQGQDSTFGGTLTGAGAGLAGAPVCVFSSVVNRAAREFLGIAVTGAGGSFNFAVGAGPSRSLEAVYRPDQRELSASAKLLTRVRPTLKLRRTEVRNKTYAHFSGQVPGPDNNGVVVAVQVKSGKGWRVFRRFRTRDDGRYNVRYFFSRTASPTIYTMRTQVRGGPGYPYEPGNSVERRLTVRP